MARIAYFVAIAAVVIHGLIHLLGFVAYWPLAEVAELPYKTSLLNGRLILTNTGMRWFSLFWLLAALGLVAAAVSVVLDRSWWLPLMLTAVGVSLIITVLDWSNAFR
ncbi:MAG: ABC transporter permease, partial [Ardenticatenaceae bacterium]|nr:ABC transporter permease [Ardenticatenaceae bacterium]